MSSSAVLQTEGVIDEQTDKSILLPAGETAGRTETVDKLERTDGDIGEEGLDIEREKSDVTERSETAQSSYSEPPSGTITFRLLCSPCVLLVSV